ncbi:MAG: hypothetical protein HZB65_00405 [Candidatus Aenigmarchaeota archaeon]|nr:hypothetical protein [Candidatus Aenigmarchaeota archaeon]
MVSASYANELRSFLNTEKNFLDYGTNEDRALFSEIQRNLKTSNALYSSSESNEEMSDNILYQKAERLAKSIRAGYENSHRPMQKAVNNQSMNIVPYMVNGNMYLYDSLSGSLIASMTKQYNGLYSYYGPVGGIAESLFGRGGIFGAGGPYHQMADSNFFNYDRKLPKIV